MKYYMDKPTGKMKPLMVIAFATTLTAASYGQGTIALNNYDNTGVYEGAGGSVTNPVYSANVTANGLIFTTDPTEQAGNLGGEAGSMLIGDDFSWALYGGSSSYTLTLLASCTGSQIVGDNLNYGCFYEATSGVAVPGSVAEATVYLELYVWEGNTYANYAEAMAAGDYCGETGVFANASGGGFYPAVALTGMPDILVGAPEPGTTVLLAVGGAFGLLLRLARGRTSTTKS